MTLLLNLQGAGACSNVPQDKATKLLLLRIFAGFWTLGLLNNSAYVIMIAGEPSGVAGTNAPAAYPTRLAEDVHPSTCHLMLLPCSNSSAQWVDCSCTATAAPPMLQVPMR
jgi:hypothetical protein